MPATEGLPFPIPHDGEQCTHAAEHMRQKHMHPKQPEGRLTIQSAKASPEQLAAWRRLWAKLLAAPTTTTAERPEKGKTIGEVVR